MTAIAALMWAGVGLAAPDEPLALPAEKHLRNVRQLTFGGENAEAYFSADGKHLIFQSHAGETSCDQIFIMDADGSHRRQVSSGGRTTCSFFFPDEKRILYSSTRGVGPRCPPPPDYSHGYVWALYRDYDIFSARIDGSRPRRLTHTRGYDAEATVSPDGRSIVFTSARDGDLDIYVMDAEGRRVQRLTSEPGYDGGAFFSPDGTKIVYRAHHPKAEQEIAEYRRLLADGLVRPSRLEIMLMDRDGSNKRQITNAGAASFAPFFHPDGRRIIFASNLHDPRSRNFDLYLIGIDGRGLERITWHEDFDSFPMFTRDGRRLVWASNRNQARSGETNLFIADWVD
jgi:Tol biopolymer transport system component